MKKVKLIAVLAALAAAVCLYYFLSQASKPQEISKTSVVAAAADIPENTVVTADMFINPTYLVSFFDTEIGKAMMAGGLVMEFLGFLVIRKIVDVRY